MNFEKGRRFSVAAFTGIIAAALAQNSPLFGMRLSPTSTSRARIERVRLQFNTVAAFTTPITAGRRLELIRAKAAALAGGSAITDIGQRDSDANVSDFDETPGGDVRIAGTGALTQVGVTFEAVPLKAMPLTHVGAAGSFQDMEFAMNPNNLDEIVLQPGELLVVRNPVAMDAGGTFQLGVMVDWREVPIL